MLNTQLRHAISASIGLQVLISVGSTLTNFVLKLDETFADKNVCAYNGGHSIKQQGRAANTSQLKKHFNLCLKPWDYYTMFVKYIDKELLFCAEILIFGCDFRRLHPRNCLRLTMKIMSSLYLSIQHIYQHTTNHSCFSVCIPASEADESHATLPIGGAAW